MSARCNGQRGMAVLEADMAASVPPMFAMGITEAGPRAGAVSTSNARLMLDASCNNLVKVQAPCSASC